MKTSHEHTSLRRGIISALVGLALVVLLQFGASELVRAQIIPGGGTGNVNMEDVVPYITKNSSETFKRIGSLAVGVSSLPSNSSWMNGLIPNLPCTRHGVPEEVWNDLFTCLDVTGSGNFAKLWVMQQALIHNRVFVTNTIPSGGGSGLEEMTNVRFIVEDISGNNDSMMVSGLGRYSGGNFAPVNYTTLRPTCATTNGRLTNCAGETNPPIHGVCATPPNGGTYSSLDGTKVTLCATGTPSTVTDNGPLAEPRWTWTCSGSNGGINAPCDASYQAAQSYTWGWSPWGLCSGGTPGSCSGTPARQTKIDWNGNPFEWTDQIVYHPNSPQQMLYHCIGKPQFDTQTSQSFANGTAFGGAPQSALCIEGQLPMIGITGAPEPSVARGYWDFLNINRSKVITDINNSESHPIYSGGGSCNGKTEGTCTAVQGCSWNPGTSGTQTRNAQCIRTSDGQVVSDSFCTPPKPAPQTQPC